MFRDFVTKGSQICVSLFYRVFTCRTLKIISKRELALCIDRSIIYIYIWYWILQKELHTALPCTLTENLFHYTSTLVLTTGMWAKRIVSSVSRTNHKLGSFRATILMASGVRNFAYTCISFTNTNLQQKYCYYRCLSLKLCTLVNQLITALVDAYYTIVAKYRCWKLCLLKLKNGVLWRSSNISLLKNTQHSIWSAMATSLMPSGVCNFSYTFISFETTNPQHQPSKVQGLYSFRTYRKYKNRNKNVRIQIEKEESVKVVTRIMQDNDVKWFWLRAT